MKALTICQPYAHLICLPDDNDLAKRVENRTWPTTYRGPLLIHAGKSRQWLVLPDKNQPYEEDYGLAVADMQFGAIVGIANLVDCFSLVHPMDRESAYRRRPWLASHQHVEGPFCFVLAECRKFESPIVYRGAQGLFDVPKDVVAEAIEAIDGPPKAHA